jgi:hypothetical protein
MCTSRHFVRKTPVSLPTSVTKGNTNEDDAQQLQKASEDEELEIQRVNHR